METSTGLQENLDTVIAAMCDSIATIRSTTEPGNRRLVAMNQARNVAGDSFGADGFRVWDLVVSEFAQKIAA